MKQESATMTNPRSFVDNRVWKDSGVYTMVVGGATDTGEGAGTCSISTVLHRGQLAAVRATLSW